MLIVGELINASRQAVGEAISRRDETAVRILAIDQRAARADFIDVNAGVFVDQEADHLQWLVTTVQESTDAPCCIDSPDPKAIEAALSRHRGAAMINSISLEKHRYDSLLPLLAGTDLKVVALCMDDEGMPETASQRLEIAYKLVNGLVRAGIPVDNIYVDPLVHPKSRELLSRVSDADLYNEAFPFGTAQEISVGYATPLAMRMSFAGELGWELYIPADFAPGAFDALMEAGEDLGVKLVGLHAVDSLRLERGFRHWPSDIDPDCTPLETGLGFAVKFNKGDFLGREALLKQKNEGMKRKLVMFTINDPEPLIYHDETIYRNGELIGSNTHGAYGHFIGSSVGMCLLNNPEGITDEWIMDADYEIGVADKRYPITIYLTSPYDPKGERAKM